MYFEKHIRVLVHSTACLNISSFFVPIAKMVQVLICHHDTLKHTHSLWLLDLGICWRMLYSSPNGFLILLGSHCYRL
jgi:hypothetical protein